MPHPPTSSDSEVGAQFHQVLQDLPRFTRDHEYFRDQWDFLVRNYDGQWVAVYNERVVAHHDTIEGVVSSLHADGIRSSSAAIHFVTTEKRLFFF